ncbi:MAG: CDP-alcohol phosphatidyltransferase family protein [Nitrospinota bacterium]|nr:CDP-alcohol phosphatidyltransferase family protein [Nitrospinota bacterium]
MEKPPGAILILASPPDTSHPGDWYSRKIVGVPFLLLNLLNLQRGGVERVAVYHPALNSSQAEPLRRLVEDSRVQGEVEWVLDPEALDRIVQDESCRLLVNGGALHDKTDIADALAGIGNPKSAEAARGIEISRQAALNVIQDLVETGEISSGSAPDGSQEKNAGQNLVVFAGSPETRVRREADFKIQRERLLTRGGMATDSFMDRWVSRFFSRQFTRLFIDTPVTPNQVTWMHLVVGVGSAWFFYQGTYSMVVAGAVLLMISAWLDATDGELARLRFQQSRFGMILDIIGDNVVHWAVFLGIGWGAAQITGDPIYKYCGVFSVAGAVLSFLLLQASVFQKRGGGSYEPSGWEDELANRDFLYFLLVMALVNQLNIFIAITAVGSNVFAAYVFYKKRKMSQRVQEQ